METRTIVSRLYRFVVDVGPIVNFSAIIGLIVTILYEDTQLRQMETHAELATADLIMDNYYTAKANYHRSENQFSDLEQDEPRIRQRLKQEAILFLDYYMFTIEIICRLYNEELLSEVPKQLVASKITWDLQELYEKAGLEPNKGVCDAKSTYSLGVALERNLGSNP